MGSMVHRFRRMANYVQMPDAQECSLSNFGETIANESLVNMGVYCGGNTAS